MPSSSKKSKGRQKIQMKKMANESNLQVTFSKRRSGLFKKASELCTLCGVEVGLIVFSPGDKAFSFGHPNVDALIHRFLTGAPPPLTSDTVHFMEAHRTASVRDLNEQLADLTEELEAGRRHAEEMNRLRKETQARWWWASPVDEMSVPQLKQFKVALEELKRSVIRHSEKVRIQSGINNVNPAATPFFVAGSSSASSSNPVVPQMLFPPVQFQNSLLQNEHQFEGNMGNQYYSYTAMLQGYGPFGHNNGFY